MVSGKLFKLTLYLTENYERLIAGCDAVRQNVSVRIGDTVHLTCATSSNTSVDWIHNRKFVYSTGQTYENHSSKYSIDNSVEGQYTLVIKHVTPAEAGNYFCVDSVLATYSLTVTGKIIQVTFARCIQ